MAFLTIICLKDNPSNGSPIQKEQLNRSYLHRKMQIIVNMEDELDQSVYKIGLIEILTAFGRLKVISYWDLYKTNSCSTDELQYRFLNSSLIQSTTHDNREKVNPVNIEGRNI